MVVRRFNWNFIKLLTICLLLISIAVIPAQAQMDVPAGSIRVALGLDLNSADFSIAIGEYELINYLTQRIINPSVTIGNGTWLIAPAGSSNLQLSNGGTPIVGLSGSMILLRQKNPNSDNVFRFKNKRYRGDLLLENINGKLQAINIIDVEQYLYGVVGAEMGSGAPNEALKAQAVVSRTYALYYKEHPQLYYDLGITTQWQVYNGYDSELLSGIRVKAAIDETKGQLIYYNGSLIQAFFHANSGGFTEYCENVWYLSIPYIRPVAAPEDAYAMQAAQSNGYPASTYVWQKTFSKNELNTLISRWNSAHPTEVIQVGEIKSLRASRAAVDPTTREFLPRETDSGRVTQLDIVGSRGVMSFYKDRIRSVLDLRSTLFDITTDSMVSIWNALGIKDTFGDTKEIIAVTADGYKTKLNGDNGNYYVAGADGITTISKEFSTLTISGKGYGHGLGMSQWGARGLAVQGSDYQSIILHYYNQDKNDGTIVIRTN